MEKEFINGLSIKPPRDKAPDWVKANISIKREDLIAYLSSKTDEWLNVDVKVSQKGNWYCELNNWKPNQQQPQQQQQNNFNQQSNNNQNDSY